MFSPLPRVHTLLKLPLGQMSSQSTSRLSILSGRCLWRRQDPNEVSDQRTAFFPKQGPLRPTNSCTSAATQDGRVLRRYWRRWKPERLFTARRIVRGCADPGIAVVSTVTDHAFRGLAQNRWSSVGSMSFTSWLSAGLVPAIDEGLGRIGLRSRKYSASFCSRRVSSSLPVFEAPMTG